MSFADDISDILVTAGVGTKTGAGKNIFVGERVNVPSGDGPFLSVTATGGVAPMYTQNKVTLPAYQRPSVQLVARAASRAAAETLLIAAYAALFAVRNVTVNGAFYLHLHPRQEIFPIGLDEVGRPRVAVNFDAIKTYS